MALLEVRDLHTAFTTPAGTVNAVNGVSFNLERGKVLGDAVDFPVGHDMGGLFEVVLGFQILHAMLQVLIVPAEFRQFPVGLFPRGSRIGLLKIDSGLFLMHRRKRMIFFAHFVE